MSDSVIALKSSNERPANAFSGYLMLFVLLVVIVLQAFGIFRLATDNGGVLEFASIVVGPVLLLLIIPGFYMTSNGSLRNWRSEPSRF